MAALKYAVLPAGGIAGAFLAGWATDRWFGGRRIPVLCALLVMLGCLTLLYDQMAQNSPAGTIALLVLIGFAIFGPQVLLVGTAPADLARRGTAAAAAGFVNFMGYLGAFTGDQVTGYLVQHYEWRTAILFWAGCAFAAAAVSTLLWNARAQRPDHDPPLAGATDREARNDVP
jgi:sugar phosphate permease